MTELEALYADAAKMRDRVGFIGSVPECIAWQEDEIQRLRQLLHIFHCFTIQNVESWKRGAEFHHPIWTLVRSQISHFGEAKNPFSPDEEAIRLFIEGRNRDSLDDITRQVRRNLMMGDARLRRDLDDEIPF